ncbi:MAG: amidohydrolase [candidate division WOR-3 bacterium]
MRQILIADKVLINNKLFENKAVLIDDNEILEVFDSFESEITHIPVKTFPSGSILMPAFIDTHTHLASYGLSLSKPNLYNFETKTEVIDFIQDYIKKEDREFYIFLSYDESRWKDEQNIQKDDLDKISKNKPIILRRVCGHKAVLNSKALELVKDIEGINFKTGIALEYLPLNIYQIFKPSIYERKEGILKAQDKALNLGIKSVVDITDVESFKAYQQLKREGKLKLRVGIVLYEKYFDYIKNTGLEINFGDDNLKFLGIKIFLDGSVGAGTADKLLKTDDELEWILKQCQDYNLQLLAHAIGEKAINQFINIFEKVIKNNYLRHRIEHFEFPYYEDIKRARDLNIYISMQPNFVELWGGFDNMYAKKLPYETLRRCNPYKTILENNLKLSFSSDCMPLDTFLGIRGAINHFIENERLSLEEALYLYSTAGSEFLFMENKIGKIEPGYYPDLIVLDVKDKDKFSLINWEIN